MGLQISRGTRAEDHYNRAMRNHAFAKFLITIIFPVALCGACATAPRDDSNKSVETQVRETIKMQMDAWNRGDIRGFMAGYYNSADTSFLSGTKLTRGFQPVLENYEKHYPAGKQGNLQFQLTEVVPLSADAAYALGSYRLSGEVTQSGMFTLILRRHDGRFVIVHDHTAADPDPAGAPPRKEN